MKSLMLFSASWCPTCQPVKAVVKAYDQYVDVKPIIVDVDEMPNLAKQYGIRSIPTMILFEDGNELGRRTGVCSKNDLAEFLA